MRASAACARPRHAGGSPCAAAGGGNPSPMGSARCATGCCSASTWALAVWAAQRQSQPARARPCWIRPCRCTYVGTRRVRRALRWAALGWAGAVVVVAARRQGAVCRRRLSSAYVRPAGTAVGDSVAAHGLQLRVLVRCVWYSVCHGGDPMMRGRCCWLHGRCQISRRSNPNPSSAMLDAAPGERAEQRHCSAPSPSPLAPAATSSDHR